MIHPIIQGSKAGDAAVLIAAKADVSTIAVQSASVMHGGITKDEKDAAWGSVQQSKFRARRRQRPAAAQPPLPWLPDTPDGGMLGHRDFLVSPRLQLLNAWGFCRVGRGRENATSRNPRRRSG